MNNDETPVILGNPPARSAETAGAPAQSAAGPDQGAADVRSLTVQQFATLFPANSACHGLMMGLNPDGSKNLKTVSQPVTQALLLAHLSGDLRLGYLPVSKKGASVGVIDIDKHKVPDVTASLKGLQDVCTVVGLTAHAEWSTRGGVHLWVFFAAPLPAVMVRRALQRVVDLAHLPANTEVYPKGDSIESCWILMPYSGAFRHPQGLGETFIMEAADSATPIPVWDLTARLQINPVVIAEALAGAWQVPSFSKAAVPATTTSDAAPIPAQVVDQLIGMLVQTRPGARHDTAGALLNVAERAGKLVEMAAALQTQEVYDRWFPDGDRDHEAWCAEIRRWVSDVTARGGVGRGLPYLREQGFDVSEQGSSVSDGKPVPYAYVDGQIVHFRPGRKGTETVELSYFVARITTEIIVDDGVTCRRYYEISGAMRTGEKLDTIRVPAEEFASLGWLAANWQSGAIVVPGRGNREHFVAAVQYLSQQDLQRRQIFSQTGWRRIGPGWAYLSSSGAMGASGLDPTTETYLPDVLQKYALPAPETRTSVNAEGTSFLLATVNPAVTEFTASVSLLDLAPDEVTVPLWLAAFRAVLCPADFTIWIEGQTGVGKSELASIMLTHYGAGLSSRGLPSWSSTPNYLEDVLFTGADALVVIDDYAPESSQGSRGAQPASRMLRAQGNGAGRGRMEANGSLRSMRPPRCLLMITAEGEPGGHSLQARALIVPVRRNSVNWEKLTVAQANGEQGLHAQVLSGYVRWLALRLDAVRAGRDGAITRYRPEFKSDHARTAAACGELMWGLDTLLEYLRDSNLLASDARGRLRERCLTTLRSLASNQGPRHQEADPVLRFVEGIRSLVSSGQATIIDIETKSSHPPGRPCIGYYKGAEVLLLPQVAIAEVQRLLDRGLVITQATLVDRLAETGWLTTDGTHRQPKRMLPEGRTRVMVFQRNMLFPPEDS